MTMELTQEEVVTKLLLKHEILKKTMNDLGKTSTHDLGSYLKSIPKDELSLNINESSKYCFINV